MTTVNIINWSFKGHCLTQHAILSISAKTGHVQQLVTLSALLQHSNLTVLTDVNIKLMFFDRNDVH